jgi:hypothetical protein
LRLGSLVALLRGDAIEDFDVIVDRLPPPGAARKMIVKRLLLG